MPGTQGRSGRRVSAQDPTRNDGEPSRPSYLSPSAMSFWTILLDQIDGRILRRADQHLLGGLCELLAQSARLPSQIAAEPDITRQLQQQRLLISTIGQIARLSILFGLSPRDRASLNIEPEEEIDDVEAWLMS